MTSCEKMNVSEVYKCSTCGLELEVKTACHCATDPDCKTHERDGVCCDLNCCGSPLVKA